MLSEGSRNSKLFAVDGEAYGWDDVVALADLRGEWAELSDRVKRGLAAIAELEARREPVPDDQVEEAARGFRYDRDLLAADELTAWLERHRLSMEDWFGYLRRRLADERLPGSSCVVREDAVEAAVWAEGICSGRLERLAQELVRLAAVSPGTPLQGLDTAFADFCATIDEEAEAREVEANRLEWLRIAYEALVAENEGAALEAALCIRVDGESMQAVARRARLELEEDECWLDELEPALATRLLAAAPGDLVGPVPVDGRFVVAQVLAKTEPSLDDAAVRVRAQDAAIERAVSRLVADRVVRL